MPACATNYSIRLTMIVVRDQSKDHDTIEVYTTAIILKCILVNWPI